MAQITKALAESILTGDGITRHEVEQLCRFFLANQESEGPIYTCIGKGGEYEYLGTATGAGKSRGQVAEVYRDRETKRLFVRGPQDFWERMELIEALPELEPVTHPAGENNAYPSPNE